MTTEGWLQVPVGPDSNRWNTRLQERTVLVVAHSVTALQRLLDATALFESDKRIQTVFTQGPGVFAAGTRELLDSLCAAVIPWQQAVRTSFDLALASGYFGLAELHAPVVVLPHGAGYNKFVRTATRPGAHAARPPVYGLSTQHLLRDGNIIPSAVVLSHEDERSILKEHCPEALPAAFVAGDPCLDRILLSKFKRADYRRRLGIVDRHGLLILSSTWGADSLYGATEHLLDQVAQEALTHDVAVAILLHPNVWFGHSPWQVRAWFRRYHKAGMRLIEPYMDWRSYLICADWFIGDYGSVSLYALTMDIPQLRTEFPEGALVQGSAMTFLQEAVPTMRPDIPLFEQLSNTASTIGTLPRVSAIEQITSQPNTSARLLRTLFYQQMKLEEPASEAAMEVVPPPENVFSDS